jgi:hypothetical protein
VFVDDLAPTTHFAAASASDGSKSGFSEVSTEVHR